MGCSSKTKSANTERGTEKDFFISKCVIFEKYDTRAITGRITKKSPERVNWAYVSPDVAVQRCS